MEKRKKEKRGREEKRKEEKGKRRKEEYRKRRGGERRKKRKEEKRNIGAYIFGEASAPRAPTQLVPLIQNQPARHIPYNYNLVHR